MFIVYSKAVLYIGHNCYFHTSIRANDSGENIIDLNSNIKLFRDANLYTIEYIGVHLKKATRIGINTSVYSNSLFLELIILVHGLNVVRTIYNIFSARRCLYFWTPASYILSIELPHREF